MPSRSATPPRRSNQTGQRSRAGAGHCSGPFACPRSGTAAGWHDRCEGAGSGSVGDAESGNRNWRGVMLWIAGAPLARWLPGFSVIQAGSLIYILLVIAVVALQNQLITGQRSARGCRDLSDDRLKRQRTRPSAAAWLSAPRAVPRFPQRSGRRTTAADGVRRCVPMTPSIVRVRGWSRGHV